jgi:hypothetical protein
MLLARGVPPSPNSLRPTKNKTSPRLSGVGLGVGWQCRRRACLATSVRLRFQAMALAGFFFGAQISAAAIAAGPMARYCAASEGAFAAARLASLFFGDILFFPEVMVVGGEGPDMTAR